MKKQFVALLMLMSICFAGAFAQEVKKSVLVDYEGKAEGKEIPEWVLKVAEGNRQKAVEALGINLDQMETFVIMNRRSSKYSDYADKEDLKKNLKDRLQYEYSRNLSEVDTSDSTYSQLRYIYDMCIDFISDMLVETGFVSRVNTFWGKIENSDNSYYEYYSVWGIDKSLWYATINCFNFDLEDGASFSSIKNWLEVRLFSISCYLPIEIIMESSGISYPDIEYDYDNPISLKELSNEIKDPYLSELFRKLHDINFFNLEIIEYYINELEKYESDINRAKGLPDDLKKEKKVKGSSRILNEQLKEEMLK